MVNHVIVPLNVYNLYSKACEFMVIEDNKSVMEIIRELNAFKPENFDRDKFVIVDIDDWQAVFNAGVACWMGQEVISRLTLAQTLTTEGKVLH